MGRAPCCEKMGLKKGPWTPEEDHILVTYVQQYGHGNWRALPKLAGLLRCGKSCRLRWTNYLRPDIKRGNFSREEEEAIINLHEMLGNRWSAIAARLPGRTDNEIKNVWHTHLKKRLNQNRPTTATSDTRKHFYSSKKEENAEAINPSSSDYAKSESLDCGPVSPPQCTSSSDTSSGSVTTKVDYEEALLPEVDESFWSEVLSAENSEMMEELQAIIGGGGSGLQVAVEEPIGGFSLDMYDNDFWYNIFTGAEQIIPEMLEI